MDEKINLKAVDQYCEAYARRVLDGFFTTKQIITGPEILSLCNLRQINLFVVHELFKSWKQESLKLRSAYFDFDAAPVRDALENLLSTLSNHIAIDRKNLEPLLQKATRNTMMLVIDPYDFFADLIEEKEVIDYEEFKDQLRYVKINKAPLERLFQKIEEKGVSELSGNEAFGMLDSILEEVNFTPEEVDGYLTQFSQVLPISLDKFYTISEPKTVTREAPVSETKPVEQKVTPQERPPVSKATINDHMAKGSRLTTLADNFNKIGKIKDSLTINQKFMFTKVLFHGDFELFSKAIEDLDRQDNIAGAMRYLEQNYEEWDRESEEFHEFMELVEKRF